MPESDWLDRPTDEDIEIGTAFPDGYVHLPKGIDSEWLKQFCAEQLVTVRNRQGFSKLEWQKMRERNEALDCRVYARALISMPSTSKPLRVSMKTPSWPSR